MELRGHSTADDHTFQHAPPEGPPWSRHSPWYWPNCLRRPTLRTHLRGRDEPGAHQNLFRRAARRSIRPTYLFSPGPPQKSTSEESPLRRVGSRAGRLAAGRLAAACSLANSPQRARCFSRSLSAGRFFFSPVFFRVGAERARGMARACRGDSKTPRVVFQIVPIAEGQPIYSFYI